MSAHDEGNPYVGLRPFDTDDSLYFFGRNAQTAELLEILRVNRFIGVVGSSGSGKSSLVRAGLLPKLLGGFLVQGSDRWRVVDLKPGERPIGNLAEALLLSLGSTPSDAECAALEQTIRDGHTDAVLAFVANRFDQHDCVCVLVDQFEEIFAFRGRDADEVNGTVDPVKLQRRADRKAEANDFVDLLLALAQKPGVPVYVVLTMRTDFLGDCDVFYGLPEALNRGRYLVPRLTRQQLREAIEGPVMLMRALIAPRLLDQLTNELGDRFDRLPVLQHALMRTWDEWKEAGGMGLIDIAQYKAAGALEGALSQDAKAAAQGLDMVATGRLFKRLTSTDSNQRRIRTPARLSELVAATGLSPVTLEVYVERFRENGRNFLYPSDEGTPDDPRINISHESLIRQWDQLRSWVDEEREWREQFEWLVDRARKSAEGDASPLTGADLQVALRWRAGAAPTLPLLQQWASRYARRDDDFAIAIKYLDDSKRLVDSLEERLQQEKSKKTRVMVGVSMTLLVMAMVTVLAGFFALRSSKRALFDRRVTLAKSLSTTDPTAAALVLAEFESSDLVSRDLEAFQSIAKLDLALAVLHGGPGAITWAATDNSGSRIVTAGEDGTARIFFSTGQGKVIVLRGHRLPVRRAVFNRNGTSVLTASWDSTAILWHADGTGQPVIFRGHKGPVLDANFSPDGNTVVTASGDGTVRLWNLSGTEIASILAHPRDVGSVEFSHDGKLLVSTPLDSVPGAARVWRVQDRRLVAECAHRSTVNRASFSNDDQWIVTASRDSTARICSSDSTARRRPPVVLKGHTGPVYDATFSQDGRRVVTASDDSTARVWRVADSATLLVLRGHTNLVHTAQFDATGSLVVTASYDSTVGLWHADSAAPPVLLRGHKALVSGAWFSPDGARVISASADGTVRVWRKRGPLEPIVRGQTLQAQSGNARPVTVLEDMRKGHTGRVFDVDFSPDTIGALIVTASEDSTARIWKTFGKDSAIVLRHQGIVHSARFSPDGRIVGTASGDGTARLWSVTGESLAVLQQPVGNAVHKLRFSPDGRHVATADESGAILLWTVGGSSRPVELTKHGGPAWSVEFNGDGTRVVSAGWDGTVRVSPVDGKGEPVIFTEHLGKKVHKAVFSPDGLHVASASEDGTARVWDLSGKEAPRILRHSASVLTVAYSQDGRLVTASHDKTVRVWPASGNGAPIELTGFEQEAWTARFSPDGKSVAGASWDRTTRVWPSNGNGAAMVLSGHSQLVHAIAFNREGTRLASVSFDGRLAIYWVSPVDLLSLLKASTTECLQPDFRVRSLEESERDAQKKFAACEDRHDRKPAAGKPTPR